MYIPSRDLDFHLWWIDPFCSASFSTYTGHPNGFQCLDFGWTSVLPNFCRGDLLLRSQLSGALLIASFATLSAYGHRFAVIACGHLCWACIIIDLLSSCSSLMRRSHIPFWWCALTPAKVRSCLALRQAWTHLIALNMPLSAW